MLNVTLLFLTMASLSKRQVLLVDDDPAIRACIAMLLEAAGYDVAAAEDGLEGSISSAKRIKPALYQVIHTCKTESLPRRLALCAS
jgi:response regulator RpfG family c-di-GMP phosphodiesterase